MGESREEIEMIVLGLGGLLNDPACVVLKDGELAAAVEQNKVSRERRIGELPEEAILNCLTLARANAHDVACVAIARPFAEGPETGLHLQLRSMFPKSRIAVVDHHVAHAASAYYASGFEHATVLTLDRTGDFRCGSIWRAAGNDLHLENELYYPDSIADVYSRVAELLGYEPNAGEHKVQWRSTMAEPDLAPLFAEMLPVQGGELRQVDRSWFDGDRVGRGGFSARLYDRLGIRDSDPIDDALGGRIAAGMQRAMEDAVASIAGTGEHLCLAGGLFLNSLLVAAIERSGQFKEVFVQPVSGNSGTALGALFHAWHHVLGQSRRIPFHTLALGPSFDAEQTKKVLENCKLHFRYLLTVDELLDAAVEELQSHKIVAWMQERMEFGPRALGNRSILASPLNPYSTENLNIFIKHREPFRKFAASVPVELAPEYFEVGPNSRYLTTVGRVRPAYKSQFEAATMGGGMIRVHTVSERDNPLYWRLLHHAGKKTGLPVLYNTSFNLFADPMVCTPRDAVRSFYSSGIDSMFAGHFLMQK